MKIDRANINVKVVFCTKARNERKKRRKVRHFANNSIKVKKKAKFLKEKDASTQHFKESLVLSPCQETKEAAWDCALDENNNY